jgi:hypothetical protein
MPTLARLPVFTNGAHAGALASQLQRYPHSPPQQLLDLTAKVASPFFSHASLCTQLCPMSTLHPKTTQDLARCLVLFLSDGDLTRFATMSDTLPFLWTYMDVDVDLHGWQDRFPFAPLFDRILASMTQQGLCRLHTEPSTSPWWRMSDTMRRYVRMCALGRAADDWRTPERVLTAATEARTIRSMRLVFLRRRWALQQVLWRLQASWALGPVARLVWGCTSWLGVLERAEPAEPAET